MRKEYDIARARAFAVAAHGDQTYGAFPYVVHLDQVALICRDFWFDGVLEQVAYLHDVLEDTGVTSLELELEFGASVAEAVALITDTKGETRKERKAKTYERLAGLDVTRARWAEGQWALIVKAADRLANVRMCALENNESMLKMYREEQPEFENAVHRYGLNSELMVEIESWLELV